MATKAPELKLALRGPGVTPATVDTVQMLQLANSYFRLLVKVGAASELPLGFRGLQSRASSAALAATPSSMPVAKIVTERALRIVLGTEEPPSGTAELASDLRRLLQGLPGNHAVSVVAGKWSRLIQVPKQITVEGPWETSEFRAKLMRVGGADPAAQFVSKSESWPFSFEITEDEARGMLGLLYREVDVEASFCRDHLGRIEKGKMLAIHPLEGGDSGEAWRSWFRENAKEWDAVLDIESELGRDLH